MKNFTLSVLCVLMVSACAKEATPSSDQLIDQQTPSDHQAQVETVNSPGVHDVLCFDGTLARANGAGIVYSRNREEKFHHAQEVTRGRNVELDIVRTEGDQVRITFIDNQITLTARVLNWENGREGKIQEFTYGTTSSPFTCVMLPKKLSSLTDGWIADAEMPALVEKVRQALETELE